MIGWIFDRQFVEIDGKPVRVGDVLRAAGAVFSVDRRVALDEFEVDGEVVRVSTVFLGLDHQFGEGAPLVYETMVFGAADDYQARWSTREQAEIGHRALVERLKAGA